MKKISILLILITITFVACNQADSDAKLKDSTLTASNALSPEDEMAVAAAVDSLNKGILDPEKNLLENIASDALSYGHSGGKVQNKAEFVDDLVNGSFDFQSVNTANQTISVSGDNAIVRHIFTAKATNAGAPVDLNIGNVLVWRKESGQWKLLARQAFKVPEPVKK